MGDDATKRLTVSFPIELASEIERIAKEEDSSASIIVVRACRHWLRAGRAREALKIAQESPEYQDIMKEARKKLGLQ